MDEDEIELTAEDPTCVCGKRAAYIRLSEDGYQADCGTHTGQLNEAPQDIWAKLRLVHELCDDLVAIAPDVSYRIGGKAQERWDVIRPGELAEANHYNDIIIASSPVSALDAVNMALAMLREGQPG